MQSKYRLKFKYTHRNKHLDVLKGFDILLHKTHKPKDKKYQKAND